MFEKRAPLFRGHGRECLFRCSYSAASISFENGRHRAAQRKEKSVMKGALFCLGIVLVFNTIEQQTQNTGVNA
jgi:hypothetical protein